MMRSSMKNFYPANGDAAKLTKYSLSVFVMILLLIPTLSHAFKFGALNDVDRELPVIEMQDLDNEVWTAKSFEGKLTVVNFWATWCAPCREEMPSLNRAWEKIRGDGIAMVAINIGDKPADIHRFLDEVPIDFTVLRATDPSALSQWGVKGLPTTLVVDQNGKIIKEFVGPAEWDQDELLDPIRALL